TGEGESELLSLIAERLIVKTPQDVVAIRERQITGLRAAESFLGRVLELTHADPLPFELVQQHLPHAPRGAGDGDCGGLSHDILLSC
ncbi:hypothetical protein Q6298_28310, partial [Klebsiella pneumoniae]|uniref:hypothetical protein n=1 Tax=Klebsiella pneumoniae TaxID=573 RepID=UPI00272F7DE1